MKSGIRLLGLLLFVLGATLLVLGLSETETFANRFIKEMTGRDLDETKWYIFGGISLMVVGSWVFSTKIFRRDI